MTSLSGFNPAPLKRNFNFWLWWLGSLQSALGSALASVALSFLVLRESGSVGALGVNLALSMLPGLASPLLGTAIDRLNVKVTLIAGNVLRGALQLSVGIAALRGPVGVEWLHLLALLTGLISAFYAPASMGLLPRLVARSELPRATGLLQGANQSMQLLGLAAGGLLVGRLGSAPALMADGASFLLMGALLCIVTFAARAPRPRSSFKADLLGGLRYVRASVLLSLLPLLAFFINAALAPMDMLMLPRMQHLGAGAAGFGYFSGALMAGMAAGSFALSALGERLRPRLGSVLGLLGIGVGALLLAFTPLPWQVYVVAALLGLSTAACNVSLSLLFQTEVAPEYYGRVGSLLNMLGTLGMPLTLLLLSPVADKVAFWVIFAAAGCVTVLAALAWQWGLNRDAQQRALAQVDAPSAETKLGPPNPLSK